MQFDDTPKTRYCFHTRDCLFPASPSTTEPCAHDTRTRNRHRKPGQENRCRFLARLGCNFVWILIPVFAARRVFIARIMSSQNVCPSVCLSVRLSHAGILSKRLHISSKFFHHQVALPFWFFHTKRNDYIPTGNPLAGRRSVKKITIFDPYLALSCKWCKIR